ncbi:hypothetical protein SAMN05660485_02032 [Blastococcus fimeti]|nr:hypothetical protein SAMN05660485_02032 [Blastococcus fimeti]
MSTTAVPPVPTAGTRRPDPSNPAPRVLSRLAGAALPIGVAAFVGGILTSPLATGDDRADYLEALGRDPALTELSAVLLHYGNLLLGVGVLALPLLVRGRRGWLPTLIGALLSALGLLATSGALFTDWFHMEMARELPIDQAVMISERVLSAPLQQLCFGLDPLLMLGLPVVVFGLCRAGVLGWWSLAAVVAGTALLPFSPADSNLVPALAFALIQLPLAVAGLRMVTRARSAA